VTTGRRRLRPIFLTSITTIFGLGPIMLETSFQAQFLIPMAISISLGLALSTVVTLLVLPCIYMAFEDMRTVVYWLATGEWRVVELSKDTRVEEEQEALS
jgi:hydrophobic/amphiphilic exporter-1 (mainly G- bacteria), HAE1 family